jgi:4-amino-4-deoxy-L-arabinose transferase-like glycosyltransferase
LNDVATTTRLGRVAIGAAVLAHLALRLPRLGGLPPFTDEVRFMRWSQLAHEDFFGNAFVSFSGSGKLALYPWLASLTHGWFADPIVGQRLVGVLAGVATLLLLAGLTRELVGAENRWAPVVVAWLWALLPFAVWHERLGIYEPLLNALSVAAFWAAYRAARRESAGWWMAFAAIFITGLLTKKYAAYFALYPAVWLVDQAWRQRRLPKAVNVLGAGLTIGAGLAVRAAVELALSRAYPEAAALTLGTYLSFAPAEIAEHVGRNVAGTFEVAFHYFGLPVAVLALAGAADALGEKRAGGLALPGAVGAALLVQVVGAKFFFPRYLLVTGPFVLVLAVYGVAWAGRQWREWLGERSAKARAAGAAALAAAVVATTLPGAVTMVANPTEAPLASADRWQYIEGWPAGYGLHELRAFLQDTAADGRIDVFVHRTILGMPFNGLQVYLGDEPNVKLWMSDWDGKQPLLFFAKAGEPVHASVGNNHEGRSALAPADLGRVFYVSNVPFDDVQTRLKLNPGARVLASFPRPGGGSALVVVEVPRP